MIERLCALADLQKPRVAIIDSDVPNAFATGRNQKHAAVAVTTGLWNRLEPKEVEGVLAHELSHIANRDVLVMTVASFFAMIAAVLTRVGLYSGMFGGMGGNRDSNNSVPDLAGRARRLGRDLLPQPDPDPRHLALPRVRRRPRLGADHGRAGVPDERAAEDLERDHADPAAGPAPGRGHERLLHHPDQLALRRPASSSRPTRRSRSGWPRSPRSRARWAGRSSRLGPARHPPRAKAAQRSGRRAAVRDLDRADHARDRARPEAGRIGGRLLQAPLGRRVRAGRERAAGAPRRGRGRVRLEGRRGNRTSTASSGWS